MRITRNQKRALKGLQKASLEKVGAYLWEESSMSEAEFGTYFSVGVLVGDVLENTPPDPIDVLAFFGLDDPNRAVYVASSKIEEYMLFTHFTPQEFVKVLDLPKNLLNILLGEAKELLSRGEIDHWGVSGHDDTWYINGVPALIEDDWFHEGMFIIIVDISEFNAKWADKTVLPKIVKDVYTSPWYIQKKELD